MMLNSKFRDVIKKLNYYLVRLHEGNGGLDWGGAQCPGGSIFLVPSHGGSKKFGQKNNFGSKNSTLGLKKGHFGQSGP